MNITVKDQGKKLINGKDYIVEYLDCRDGVLQVVIKGKEHAFSEKTMSFRGAKLNFRKAKVTLGEERITFTGAPITPEVQLVSVEGVIVPEDLYEVTYHKNVKLGKAYVLIAGKKPHHGSVKVPFRIVPGSLGQAIQALGKNDETGDEVEAL